MSAYLRGIFNGCNPWLGEDGSAIFMSFLGNNVPNIELPKIRPQNEYIDRVNNSIT